MQKLVRQKTVKTELTLPLNERQLYVTLMLLETFTGVLQKKILMRAVLKETPSNYISIERL